jgi:hypothetical protein
MSRKRGTRGVKGNTVSATIAEILDRDIDVPTKSVSIKSWNRVCRTVCHILVGIGYLRTSPNDKRVYHVLGRAGVRDMWFLHDALSFTAIDSSENLTHVCVHAIQTELLDKVVWEFAELEQVMRKRRPNLDTRRVYDILNVLYNMRLITKLKPCSYKWIANDVIKI